MFAKHLSTLLLLFYLIVYENNGKFLMLCEKLEIISYYIFYFHLFINIVYTNRTLFMG